MSGPEWGFRASTGLDFTHADIVDAHFQACRPTYLELLRRADIRPGWRVLDAGCGSGEFLLPIAELTGAHGAVTGVDLTPENVALANARATAAAAPCPVRVDQGDLRALSYPDNQFDAVWCANATQYLDDEELHTALRELARVVRPGGLVAVKDLDASLITTRPGDPFLFTDFFRAAAGVPGYARQLLRARETYRHLAAAGLTAIRQISVLSEHYAPFSAAERTFYQQSFTQLAGQARALFGERTPAAWAELAEPEHPANPLNDPRGYVCEGNVLATGIVAPE